MKDKHNMASSVEIEMKEKPKSKDDGKLYFKNLPKKVKTGLLTALVAMLVICGFALFTYVWAAETPSVKEEIRLRIYDSLQTGSGADFTAVTFEDNEALVRGWALPIVEGVFHDEGISIKTEEKSYVTKAITAQLDAVKEAGVIVNDENGHLTDLSKAYIANAVADAVSTALASVDLNQKMERNATYYGYNRDYKGLLKSMDTQAGELENIVDSVNDTYNSVNNITSNNTEGHTENTYLDVSDFSAKLAALRTELLAEITANRKDIVNAEADIETIKKLLGEMQLAESDILEQIQNAVAGIESITQSIEQLGYTDEQINLEITQIHTSISEIHTSITTLRTDLTQTITDVKNDLNSTIAANQESLTQNLSDAKKQLSETINNIQKELSEAAGNDKKELTQAIEDATAKSQKDLEETTKDLQSKIDALASKEQEDVQALKGEISEKYTELNTTILNNYSALENRMDVSDQKFAEALETAKSELTGKIEEVNDTFIQNLSETKNELTATINGNYTYLTDTINTVQQELKDAAKADKEELAQAITDAAAKSQKDLEETTKDLQSRIDALSSTEQKDVQDLRNEISEKYEELGTTILNNYSALENRINVSDQKFAEALETAKTELSDKIDEVSNTFEQSLTDAKMEIGMTLEALTKCVEANELAISEINQSFAAFKLEYSDEIAKLWQQVNINTASIAANAASIADLQNKLAVFAAGVDSHQKIDMIDAFTIASGDWGNNGSFASYTVTSDYLFDSTFVEVNYALQYDMTPSYSINPAAGTLTISIPADQIQPVNIAGILVYHIKADDTYEDSAATIEENNENADEDSKSDEDSADLPEENAPDEDSGENLPAGDPGNVTGEPEADGTDSEGAETENE